jgi:uncharacterized alkaline shock family protein YloU
MSLSAPLRILLLLMAFLLAVVFVFILLIAIFPTVLAGVTDWSLIVFDRPQARLIAIIVAGVGLISMLVIFIAVALSGRMRKARVRRNDVGEIDIGVAALENIALNAAKASQSGVKQARCRVGSIERQKLFVVMQVMTYADVELPVMMARVQERVKKDIEKYTGIEVADVSIKVRAVEAVATRVER